MTGENMTDGNMTGEKKICPFCAEEILAVAIKCKHCKSDLIEPQQPPRRNNQLANDPMMRMLLPVGRSPLAIVAGYAGLFALIGIGAPFAIIFGILALRDIEKNPEKTGKGRAWFGIIMGSIMIILIIIAIIGGISNS